MYTHQYEEALLTADQVIVLSPEDQQWSTYKMKGGIYHEMNLKEKAAESLKKAIFLLESKPPYQNLDPALMKQIGQQTGAVFDKEKEIANLKKLINEL